MELNSGDRAGQDRTRQEVTTWELDGNEARRRQNEENSLEEEETREVGYW